MAFIKKTTIREEGGGGGGPSFPVAPPLFFRLGPHVVANLDLLVQWGGGHLKKMALGENPHAPKDGGNPPNSSDRRFLDEGQDLPSKNGSWGS